MTAPHDSSSVKHRENAARRISTMVKEAVSDVATVVKGAYDESVLELQKAKQRIEHIKRITGA